MRVLIRLSDPRLDERVRDLCALAGVDVNPEDADLCILDRGAETADIPRPARAVVLAEDPAEPLPERFTAFADVRAFPLPLDFRALWELLRGASGENPVDPHPAPEAGRTPEPAPEQAPPEPHLPVSPPERSPARPSIDPDARTVEKDGVRVTLTPREFAVFACLARHAGEAVSRETLLGEAWADADPKPAANAPDVTVGYLRRKLAPLFGEGAIRSKRGVGYVWEG